MRNGVDNLVVIYRIYVHTFRYNIDLKNIINDKIVTLVPHFTSRG